MLPPQGLLPPFELPAASTSWHAQQQLSTSAQAEHDIPQFITPADLHRPSHSMEQPDDFWGETNPESRSLDQLFDAGPFVGRAEPLFQRLNSPQHWGSLDALEGEWSSARSRMQRLLLGQPASPESSGEHDFDGTPSPITRIRNFNNSAAPITRPRHFTRSPSPIPHPYTHSLSPAQDFPQNGSGSEYQRDIPAREADVAMLCESS